MLKVVLVGVIVSFTAMFGVVAWLSLRPAAVEVAAVGAPALAAPPPPARTVVLAWSRNVPAGTLIKPEDIGVVELPANALPPGTRPDTLQMRSEMVGGMVRRNVMAQAPLLGSSEVLRPTDGGFLAAVLAPDHRAVSVAVDAVSGTAGLIWPGDRVDLILTQEIGGGDQSVPVGRRTFGETVLKDARVIAVDQQLAQGLSPDSGTPAQQQSGNRTVTLEVLPEAAERVAVAVRLGRISLTVRAASAGRPVPDAEVAVNDPARPTAPVLPVSAQGRAAAAAAVPAGQGMKSPPTTWGTDVSPGLGVRPGSAPRSSSVRVYQGGTDGKEFKFE